MKYWVAGVTLLAVAAGLAIGEDARETYEAIRTLWTT